MIRNSLKLKQTKYPSKVKMNKLQSWNGLYSNENKLQPHTIQQKNFKNIKEATKGMPIPSTSSLRACCRSVVSSSLWPHGLLYPTRLLCPWIFQARILESAAVSSSRGSSQPRDWTFISCIGRWTLYHYTTWEALRLILGYLKILHS